MQHSLRAGARALLARFPRIDGLFRRFVWSRLHYPEAEMAFIAGLPRHCADVAIDVGAAMGGYSWLMNHAARQVIAFEPGRWHYQFLKPLLFGTHIELVCAAVGAEGGEVELITPGDDTHARHSATLSTDNPVSQTSGSHRARVRQVSLDDYLADPRWAGRSVDILKIDVEGYEFEVLRGSMRTLEQHHPLLICEIEARHNAEYARVFAALRSLGYRCYVQRAGRYEPFEADDITPMQSAAALAVRLSPGHSPAQNQYINNFVFQHPESRIKVVR